MTGRGGGASIDIGGRRIGGGAPGFVIAEIGTSHGGDLEAARRIVGAAAEAGADCAKFQAVIADEILHPNTGSVALPGGSVALYERFRALERPPEFYEALKELTEAAGLLFLCTPFGPATAELLYKLGVAAYKIASPELNYDPLVRQVAGYGRPLFLSTGVSHLADIERAVEIAGPASCLLHCVTAYPAPERDYNLRVIAPLGALFGLPVGVSDHSLDPDLVPALAVASGAAAVEKHLTLSRDTAGLDDPIALPPESFAAMVQALRRAEREGPEETVARYARERGAPLVEAVLGTGTKRLAPSERDNYGRTNRSIHALRALPQGATLREADVALLRTEKILRPGLPPSLLPTLLGRSLRRAVPAGEGITWDDLLGEGGTR